MQVARYLTFCGQSGIIFNPKKLEVGRTEVNIFGLHVTQQGVLPTKNQIETMQKYPTPKNLRDMRGFLGLVNQATFCIGPETRKIMENLKDRMKSKVVWSWTEQNQQDFNKLKELLVIDCAKGIYRLTSSTETNLALISDWSKHGSGYTLYEVTCKHPKDWKRKDPKLLCCPEEWRLIMAGGRFNTETEAKYAPLEGELLGIASALHKSRYKSTSRGTNQQQKANKPEEEVRWFYLRHHLRPGSG